MSLNCLKQISIENVCCSTKIGTFKDYNQKWVDSLGEISI